MAHRFVLVLLADAVADRARGELREFFEDARLWMAPAAHPDQSGFQDSVRHFIYLIHIYLSAFGPGNFSFVLALGSFEGFRETDGVELLGFMDQGFVSHPFDFLRVLPGDFQGGILGESVPSEPFGSSGPIDDRVLLDRFRFVHKPRAPGGARR